MKLLSYERLSKMLPEQIDKLPGPAEFRGTVVKRGWSTVVRTRRQWVGFGWVDEGLPLGNEPLLVARADDPAVPPDMEIYACQEGAPR